MAIEFEDHSEAVKAAIKRAAIALMYEAGGEIAAETKRNSRRRTGKTAGSFTYKVNESELSVTIGSNDQNALWEELGTGEYAVNGGRRGYWVFVEGQSSGGGGGKTYDLAGAKRAMACLRSKGLNAYYTNGKRPNHALERAGNTVAPKVQSAAERLFGALG